MIWFVRKHRPCKPGGVVITPQLICKGPILIALLRYVQALQFYCPRSPEYRPLATYVGAPVAPGSQRFYHLRQCGFSRRACLTPLLFFFFLILIYCLSRPRANTILLGVEVGAFKAANAFYLMSGSYAVRVRRWKGHLGGPKRQCFPLGVLFHSRAFWISPSCDLR